MSDSCQPEARLRVVDEHIAPEVALDRLTMPSQLGAVPLS